MKDEWENEREDVLRRFTEELSKATGDGSVKRQSGVKPPWYRDPSHMAAVWSHFRKHERGELVDADSGAHPFVHAAWRLLAIACTEMGNTPDNERAEATSLASRIVAEEAPEAWSEYDAIGEGYR